MRVEQAAGWQDNVRSQAAGTAAAGTCWPGWRPDFDAAPSPLLPAYVPPHLVKARGKEVEGGQDGAVGPQAVLLHHILVVDRVPDVHVGTVWHLLGVEAAESAQTEWMFCSAQMHVGMHGPAAAHVACAAPLPCAANRCCQRVLMPSRGGGLTFVTAGSKLMMYPGRCVACR